MVHASNDDRLKAGQVVGKSASRARSQGVSLSEARSNYNDVITDPERLNALHGLDILDTKPDAALNCITDLALRTFGVQVARIHLLDDVRQWVQTSCGESAPFDMPVGQSVCQYTIRQYSTLVVPNLAADSEYRDKPVLVDGEPARFYAGAPLTTHDGHNIGVLCLMDREPGPAGLDADGVELLEKMAELIVETLALRQAGASAREDLVRAIDQEPVTGLVSGRGVLVRLQRLLNDADTAEGEAVAAIEIGLAGTHRVAQAYGTAVLNGLWRDVAERLGQAAMPDEIVGRTGDVGFVVLATVTAATPELRDERLKARAQALMVALEAPFDVAGDRFEPEVSVGLARGPADSGYAHELLGTAHEAALRASKRRTPAMEWPDQEAVAAERRRLSLEGRLRRAVTESEITVFYQPIVALQDGYRVVGAEALARWPQPEGEPAIGPDVFIPLAEELGLMDRLGMQVFESSCRQLRQWQQALGNEDFWVSVNLAPSQLQDAALASQLRDVAHEAGVSPSRIKLEVTESAFEDGFEVAGQVIDELVAAGFLLALDDFGTGHSSLSRLINMPFSILKVDRSFVGQTPDGPGAAVVSSLRHLAGALRLESLGEGVEEASHEAYLRDQGYAYAQGNRYSRPLPASEFDAWCARR